MSFELNALFSLSVGIGAIIGWIRFKKTDPAYLPFLILLGAGFLNEITSIILMKAGYSNAIYFNVFALLEAVLISWQFRKWGLFERWRGLYISLQVIFCICWVAETVMKNNLNSYNSYFVIGFSSIIVVMSVSLLNKEIFKEPTLLLFNPVFLICIGLIVYFTYSILVEIFWVYGLNRSSSFRNRIYEIFSYVNLFTNLLFGFATLWIPMKRQYLLQS
jgi:hypothetical protein